MYMPVQGAHWPLCEELLDPELFASWMILLSFFLKHIFILDFSESFHPDLSGVSGGSVPSMVWCRTLELKKLHSTTRYVFGQEQLQHCAHEDSSSMAQRCGRRAHQLRLGSDQALVVSQFDVLKTASNCQTRRSHVLFFGSPTAIPKFFKTEPQLWAPGFSSMSHASVYTGRG